MGIRIFKIHHTMGHKGRVCTANHDEHVPDYIMVFFWNFVLVHGEEIQDLDQGQLGSSNVSVRERGYVWGN